MELGQPSSSHGSADHSQTPGQAIGLLFVFVLSGLHQRVIPCHGGGLFRGWRGQFVDKVKASRLVRADFEGSTKLGFTGLLAYLQYVVAFVERRGRLGRLGSAPIEGGPKRRGDA